MMSRPRVFVHLVLVLAVASFSIQAQQVRDRQLTPLYDLATVEMPVDIVSVKFNGKEMSASDKVPWSDEWLRNVSFTLKNVSEQPIGYVCIGFKFPLKNGFVVVTVLNYGVDYSHGDVRRPNSPPPIQPRSTQEFTFTKARYDAFLHVLAQADAPKSFDEAFYFIERVSFEGQPDVIWQDGYLKRRNATDPGRFDSFEKYFLPEGAVTSRTKYIKKTRPIPNSYIVVLTDDVVSSDAPIEVRRAKVSAIANSHANTYGGKVGFIYESALKGYSIELPNEGAAIAISKLPQVKFVEQNSLGTWF
jgi:hypothetical protein